MVTNYINAVLPAPIATARNVNLERLPVVHYQFRIPPVPIETARSARATFGLNNFYIQVGEHLESILEDIHAESLSEVGIILPQITFFQFLEGLTDAQVVDAFRTRIDWRFALHLPIYSPKLRESELCEFRHRILIDPVCQCEFQKLVDRLLLFNPPINKGFRDLKNLELVSIVCSINRLGVIHAAISQTLEILACRFPGWLQKAALPHWHGRYNYKVPEFNSTVPLCQQKLSMREYLLTSFVKIKRIWLTSVLFTVPRRIWWMYIRKFQVALRRFCHVSEFNNHPANSYIQEMGMDIHYLLEEVRCSSLHEVQELREIEMLDQIWAQQFEKPSHLMNNPCKLLKTNNCDFCIHKEKRNPDEKYQYPGTL
jgi:hypothetical protein